MATGRAIDRRRLLRMTALFGLGTGAIDLSGCAKSSTSPTDTNPGSPSSTGSTTCNARVPEETAGPYPGDGSNGPDVLGLTGVVRSDIRPSFAGLSGAADGVPLQVQLTIVSASTCAPLAGFSDGASLELATVTGSVAGGLTAALSVAVPAQDCPRSHVHET